MKNFIKILAFSLTLAILIQAFPICFAAEGVEYLVTADYLNMRAEPNSTSTIVGGAAYGDIITVTKTSGNWAYATHKGKSGWFSLSYIIAISNIKYSISDSGIDLIKGLEGFSKYAYWDYTQWTIGYGTKCEENEYPNGITQEEAERLLCDVLYRYELYVNIFLANNGITIRQNQYDALVSFTYNLGNIWGKSFELKTYLINGIDNYTEAQIRYAFGNFVYAGGEKLPGLVSRREAEANHFLANYDGTNLLPNTYTTDSRCAVTLYKGDSTKKFTMMGIDYRNGITFSSNATNTMTMAEFNLNSAYKVITFDLGSVDNKGLSTAKLQVYTDGVYKTTINLSHNMQTYNYTIKVDGANKLKLTCTPDSNIYSFGLANIKGLKKADLDISGITVPAVFAARTVYNTNLTPNTYALPYGYTTDSRCPVTLYNGTNKTFLLDGKAYTNGITFTASSYNGTSEAAFNLGGIFDELSFVVGHIDGASQAGCSFDIYLDGVHYDKINAKTNTAPYTYTLKVKNANQLIIKQTPSTSSYGYALADIMAYHTHTAVIDKAFEATCTANGKTAGAHCNVCNEVLTAQETLRASGHNWSGWKVKAEPTTNKNGLEERSCSICQRSESRPLYLTSFVDVTDAAWYYNQVSYCAKRGLVTGTSKGYFSPNNLVSRAAMVQILFNMEGVSKELYSGSTGFKDVGEGEWYSNAVKWAGATGVSAGDGEGKFLPTKQLTRQELAQFIKAYTEYKCYSTDDTTTLTQFADADTVSSWALPAIKWSVAKGLISGAQNGDTLYLNPKKIAKRSELASIIMNYEKAF